MNNKTNILLLSCPPCYQDNLKNDYHVEDGLLFEQSTPETGALRCIHIETYDNGSASWRDRLQGTHNATCPNPPYQYDLIVYSPHRPVYMPFKTLAEPLPNWNKAIDEAGRITVVFLNQVSQVPESLIIQLKSRLDEDDSYVRFIEQKAKYKEKMPWEVYNSFWPWFQIEENNDTESVIADNDTAKSLESALRPFLNQKKGRWSPINVSFDLEDHPWKNCSVKYPKTSPPGQQRKYVPLLVNPAGDPHALWVSRGKGGILFLPEFEDNLAVLQSLLELPLSDLLKIDPEPIITENTSSAQSSVATSIISSKAKKNEATPKLFTQADGLKFIQEFELDDEGTTTNIAHSTFSELLNGNKPYPKGVTKLPTPKNRKRGFQFLSSHVLEQFAREWHKHKDQQ